MTVEQETEEEAVINKCLVLQTEEVEVLTSMYGTGELIFNTSKSNTSANDQKLQSSFSLRLEVNKIQVELSVRYPAKYPLIDGPIVFVRTSGYWNDTSCNAALRDWLIEQNSTSAIIMDIVMWIQDEGPRFSRAEIESVTEDLEVVSIEDAVVTKPIYTRYYILSHHLYSNKKRADIIQTAKDCHLCGFSTPGKPAVIIIEGEQTACKTFWNEIRSWNWQKINIRLTDENIGEENLKFKGFRELILESKDSKHVQTGEVKTILAQIGLADRFPILYNL